MTVANALTAAGIEGLVKEVVVEQLGVAADEIRSESRFVEDLGADSLDIVELVMALEEKLEVQIPDEDAAQLTTVGDAVKYVEARRR